MRFRNLYVLKTYLQLKGRKILHLPANSGSFISKIIRKLKKKIKKRMVLFQRNNRKKYIIRQSF